MFSNLNASILFDKGKDKDASVKSNLTETISQRKIIERETTLIKLDEWDLKLDYDEY